MRTPKHGDAYQVCVHLVDEPPSMERNYWDIPGKPWIVLCSACHARYSGRAPVELSGTLRWFSSLPELGTPPACAVHTHAVMPTAASEARIPWGAAPRSDLQLDDDVMALRRCVEELRLEVLLPPPDYAPHDAAHKGKRLRMLQQELQRRSDASTPVSLSTRVQFDMIDESLARIEAGTRLAEQTRKRLLKLTRVAQRLLKRALAQPFSGYFYRRRVYRRLVRERDDVISLITLQGLPRSYLPSGWMLTLSGTFSALERRYGSPLSDAELRRIVSCVPLADLAPLAGALEHCSCGICEYGRQDRPMETEAFLAELSGCSCAYCKFCRMTLSKIDVSKLEKTPAYRDAMLVLRQRIGGPSSLN